MTQTTLRDQRDKISFEKSKISFLVQCQDSNLRMVALALSGFSFEKSLWRSQCITALSQIVDPHLRALFAFLTPDNDSYDIVLVSKQLMQILNHTQRTNIAIYRKSPASHSPIASHLLVIICVILNWLTT